MHITRVRFDLALHCYTFINYASPIILMHMTYVPNSFTETWWFGKKYNAREWMRCTMAGRARRTRRTSPTASHLQHFGNAPPLHIQEVLLFSVVPEAIATNRNQHPPYSSLLSSAQCIEWHGFTSVWWWHHCFSRPFHQALLSFLPSPLPTKISLLAPHYYSTNFNNYNIVSIQQSYNYVNIIPVLYYKKRSYWCIDICKIKSQRKINKKIN